MAPEQHELSLEFAVVNGPAATPVAQQQTPEKSLVARLNRLWAKLRRYG